jgi:hypothetical protein
MLMRLSFRRDIPEDQTEQARFGIAGLARNARWFAGKRFTMRKAPLKLSSAMRAREREVSPLARRANCPGT